MAQALDVGYVKQIGGGQLVEGLAQSSTAIRVGAEGQVDVGAGPMLAHGP